MHVFDNKPSIEFLDFWIFNSKEEKRRFYAIADTC